MIKDKLGKRMKENYEMTSRTRLVRKIPVAIRIDGKAFHTFTKNFKKPFDMVLMDAMQRTMQYLCANIQGCVFGYTQSDEITLILQDYKTITTSAWFDYEVQKMCSIASSMATMQFNKCFMENVYAFQETAKTEEEKQLIAVYQKGIKQGAMFDARVFNIPIEEVCNLVYWRQTDAIRNSISMIARNYFTPKELYQKSSDEMQKMLQEKHQIDWQKFPVYQQRGTACYRREYEKQGVLRHEWYIDKEMPLLLGTDRYYVEQWIIF